MATSFDQGKSSGIFFSGASGNLGANTGSERSGDRQTANAYSNGEGAKPVQKIKTIGVLCHDGAGMGLRHFLFAGIIERFKSMAERHGYDVFFLSNQIAKSGLSYYDHLRSRKADGVFIVNADFAQEGVRDLLASRIPKIAIDYSDESTSCVMTDCGKSMSLLFNYIYDLGHRNIVYMHGEAGYLTDARVGSLKKAMAAKGMELPQDGLVQSKYHSIEAGFLSMREALGHKGRPTAIIACDDYCAIGAISAARAMGLSVPDDISVAGFDGFEIAQNMSPKLTTIWQDTKGMGAKAAESLIKQILGMGGRSRPENILLEPSLLAGQSCRRINV